MKLAATLSQVVDVTHLKNDHSAADVMSRYNLAPSDMASASRVTMVLQLEDLENTTRTTCVGFSTFLKST